MSHSDKQETLPPSEEKGRLRGPPGTESPHQSPTNTRYLPVALGGSHWHGRESLENIVVFGASYCTLTDLDDDNEGSPDTWVDHILRKSKEGSPIRVHNFAFAGATAEDDLSAEFSRFKTGVRDISLNKERTTYFFFLGINDCCRTPSDDLKPITEGIFDVLHELYTKFDARNFVIINVPPINRSPGSVVLGLNIANEIGERIRTWNKLLVDHANDFVTGGNEGTIFVFSSHQFLTEILDKPLDFDFTGEDTEKEGGKIWLDELHLTPAVHSILADRLLDSLVGWRSG